MSIAHERGFFWQSVWDHPANADLKRQRRDPNVLRPGDVLHVPDIRVREESAATEQRHRFRRKGTPAVLRIRVIRQAEGDEPDEEPTREPGVYREPEAAEQEWEAEADTPYAMYVDGVLVAEGSTDGDGWIEVNISPAARSARLLLDTGRGSEREIELALGHVDPADRLEGVCQRLGNLGYNCPDGAQEVSPEIERAIREFQRAESLEETGEPDEATRDRLRELHGG